MIYLKGCRFHLQILFKLFQTSRRDKFETVPVSGDDECVVYVPIHAHYERNVSRAEKVYLCCIMCKLFLIFIIFDPEKGEKKYLFMDFNVLCQELFAF
jgi:hypothetical protein